MKKVFLILFATLLVLSMAACGQEAAEPTEAPTEAATQATENKPVSPMSSNTPTLSSGGTCGGDTNSAAE